VIVFEKVSEKTTASLLNLEARYTENRVTPVTQHNNLTPGCAVLIGSHLHANYC